MSARLFIGGLAPESAWRAHDLAGYGSRARAANLDNLPDLPEFRVRTGPALGPSPVP